MSQLTLELPVTGDDSQLAQVAWDTQLAETFRPIHYLGSKLRFVEAISAALDQVDPARGGVLDLFAGSGTVSMALAVRRRVVANDIQEYSRVICSALLTASLPDTGLVEDFKRALVATTRQREQLREAALPVIRFEEACIRAALQGEHEPICDLLEHGSILAAERGQRHGRSELQQAIGETVDRLRSVGLAFSPLATSLRYFGGAYFSYGQATELDALSLAVEQFGGCRRDVLLAALLSTASEVVNTVGKQFAQPIRPRSKSGHVKRHLVAKIVRDRAIQPLQSYMRWAERYSSRAFAGPAHRVLRADYVQAIEESKGLCSVVYADPPYTRDHYSRFYHVLETLALRDNPEIAKNPGAAEGDLSRGLYREERHQSPFCIKSQAEAAFQTLFQNVASSGANLVLSYSPYEKESNARPRLMTVERILALASEAFRGVQAESIEGVSHSKLNHTRLNFDTPAEAEVLILCTDPRAS